MPHYKIYDNETGQHRLVVADSKSQARAHVADPVIDRRFAITTARVADVAQLMGSGVQVELASKPSPPEQPPLELPVPPSTAFESCIPLGTVADTSSPFISDGGSA